LVATTNTAHQVFFLDQFIIYRCVEGSRAYGLVTEASDNNRRGIYLVPAELQWSLFGAPEHEDNAQQECNRELQKSLTMALQANPKILDCLYSPIVEKVTPLGEELVALRQCFLSPTIFHTFNGFAMSQFTKIEQDWRNNGEVRWKHAMHLLRLLLTGMAALREGPVPVPVERYRERLLAVKRGDNPWPEVVAWGKELHQDFDAALAGTHLPERPDYEKTGQCLIKAQRHMAATRTLT
jgi:predicted nucleotidyltransferase